MTYKLFTDGGARGNPGPSAVGVVIQNDAGEIIYELSKFIGNATNNEAEYKALLYGIREAVEKKVDHMEVYMDSELVVKQMRREYKVKNAQLLTTFNEIVSLLSNFKNISFTHIRREKNKRADALVNQALDQNGF